jgi:hypothetical protein
MPITRDANYYDHLRDERKHEPRPGDRGFTDSDVLGRFTGDPLPLRLQPPPIAGALEVAILAQAVPLPKAAELIEAYARSQCAAARLDATATAIDRCCEAIEASGQPISRDMADDLTRGAI